ncbi:hypothetical protein HZA42_02805 [Candidatus Peregrinibacteria bacterium]|nr:hypothetical protein [Candidatus Peregrinibacteria bacterium]
MDIPQTPNTNPAPAVPAPSASQPAVPTVPAAISVAPKPAAPAPMPAAASPQKPAAPAFNLSAAPASVSVPTPDPIRSFMPSAPSATQGLPKTGFFSGKVLAALIALAVIIGGVTLGFFVFPEPFYNYVGKYLGLPAPASSREQAPTVNEQPAPPAEPVSLPPDTEQPAVGSTTEENTAPSEEGTETETETDIQAPITETDASAGTGTEEIIDIGEPAVTEEQPPVNSGGKVPRNKGN